MVCCIEAAENVMSLFSDTAWIKVVQNTELFLLLWSVAQHVIRSFAFANLVQQVIKASIVGSVDYNVPPILD